MNDINPLLDATRAFLATHAEWENLTRDELELLRKREIKKAEELMKRKPALTSTYQDQLRHLFENREKLAELPVDMIDALRTSQAVFTELSGEYQRELDLALTSAERLMNVIKETIVQQHSTSQFYGRSGTLTPQEAPRSFSVNKKA